jgi:nickel/cobalt transporter (NicO) family protein
MMMSLARRFGFGSAAWLASAASALAQSSPRPFSVGGGEGGGAQDGITGWLLAEQSRLTHLMAAKVHALHGDPSAAWGLIGLGLVYGVFHAAGPGHGKAVIASYMIANERSLKRGALLALLAALLQAMVAIVLVGAAGFVFNATASEMNRAANLLQLASYGGVVAIGLWLCWRKGGALVAAAQSYFERNRGLASAPDYTGVDWSVAASTLPSGFRAVSLGAAAAGPEPCGHFHAPDPVLLEGAFSWRAAGGTVIAAGVRPCSGAILVLVFGLAQGLFASGVEATFAMALGTAVTTGALATMAVFAKSTAVRFVLGEDSRAALVARSFEFAAAFAVLVFGVALILSARAGA